MTDSDAAKRAAALAAAGMLPPQGTLGLGSGTTAGFFLQEAALRVKDGARYACVPTSEKTRQLAAAAGIPLLDDAGPWAIDVCVDGADEVDGAFNLIKGGGGALTREKIVNQAA